MDSACEVSDVGEALLGEVVADPLGAASVVTHDDEFFVFVVVKLADAFGNDWHGDVEGVGD